MSKDNEGFAFDVSKQNHKGSGMDPSQGWSKKSHSESSRQNNDTKFGPSHGESKKSHSESSRQNNSTKFSPSHGGSKKSHSESLRQNNGTKFGPSHGGSKKSHSESLRQNNGTKFGQSHGGEKGPNTSLGHNKGTKFVNGSDSNPREDLNRKKSDSHGSGKSQGSNTKSPESFQDPPGASKNGTSETIGVTPTEEDPTTTERLIISKPTEPLDNAKNPNKADSGNSFASKFSTSTLNLVFI